MRMKKPATCNFDFMRLLNSQKQKLKMKQVYRYPTRAGVPAMEAEAWKKVATSSLAAETVMEGKKVSQIAVRESISREESELT